MRQDQHFKKMEDFIMEEHLKGMPEIEKILQEVHIKLIRVKGIPQDAMCIEPKNDLPMTEVVNLLTSALAWALKITDLDHKFGRAIEILQQQQKKN